MAREQKKSYSNKISNRCLMYQELARSEDTRKDFLPSLALTKFGKEMLYAIPSLFLLDITSLPLCLTLQAFPINSTCQLKIKSKHKPQTGVDNAFAILFILTVGVIASFVQVERVHIRRFFKRHKVELDEHEK
jgi:hypothetical protein